MLGSGSVAAERIEVKLNLRLCLFNPLEVYLSL